MENATAAGNYSCKSWNCSGKLWTYQVRRIIMRGVRSRRPACYSTGDLSPLSLIGSHAPGGYPMRTRFLLIIVVFITTLTSIGCSGSSESSSRYQPKPLCQEGMDKIAREGGYRDHADMMSKLRQQREMSDSSSSSSSQSSSSQSSSETITLDMSEEDRRELLREEDAEAGGDSRNDERGSYSSSPGGSTGGGYTHSSPPNTYLRPRTGVQPWAGTIGCRVQNRAAALCRLDNKRERRA
jgi:hypothetical protein